MNVGLLLGLFLACVLASTFFSGSETALTSLSDSAVFRLKQEGREGAARLERLRADLARTLGALLVGNTIANIGAGSIGTALAISALGDRWGVLTATLTTTILLLVFGEVTPKTLAARRPEEFALVVARPVEAFVAFLGPVTSLLGAVAKAFLRPFGAAENVVTDVTEADVKSLIALSHEQGALEQEEKEILHAVLKFGDTPVKDAMIPRAKAVLLPADAGFARVRSVYRENRYSRYPVYRGGQDEVIGILHVKDLFDVSDTEEAAFDLSRFLRPAVFVPEQKRASDLFREMRRRRFHMAVVVDELGAISGLVTLEDLIEEIVGDIADEHDEPARRPVSDGTTLILEGTYALSALERDLGVTFGVPGVETVAGLLLKRFGRIPRAGARTYEGGLELVVEKASPRAVERIRITRKAAPSPAAGERRAS